MLTKSKLLAGAAAAAALMGSTAVLAAELDAKGSVYGDFRWGLNLTDSNAGPGAAATADDLDAVNNRSVYGIKASTTQGGVTVFAKYEQDLYNDGASTSTGNVFEERDAYVGVRTALGTLQYGQISTAYMDSGRAMDPFYNTSLAGFSGAVGTINGASYGLSVLTNDVGGSGIIDNQIAYTSPVFAGVSVNAAVMTDEGAGTAEDHDWGAGLSFAGFGLKAGVQFLDLNSAGGADNFSTDGLVTDSEAVRVHAGFAATRFGVNGSFERINLTGGALDQDYAFVSAWFGVLPGTRIAVGAGDTNNSAFEGTGFTLGVFHDVIDSLTVHAGARMVDRRTSTTNIVADNDTLAYALGASYKFDLGFATK